MPTGGTAQPLLNLWRVQRPEGAPRRRKRVSQYLQSRARTCDCVRRHQQRVVHPGGHHWRPDRLTGSMPPVGARRLPKDVGLAADRSPSAVAGDVGRRIVFSGEALDHPTIRQLSHDRGERRDRLPGPASAAPLPSRAPFMRARRRSVSAASCNNDPRSFPCEPRRSMPSATYGHRAPISSGHASDRSMGHRQHQVFRTFSVRGSTDMASKS